MTSCPEARGWNFWWFLKKALVGIWLWVGQSSWGVDCGRCRNCPHSKNCVSLSSCRKPKSQEGKEEGEQRRVVSVSLFHIPMYMLQTEPPLGSSTFHYFFFYTRGWFGLVCFLCLMAYQPFFRLFNAKSILLGTIQPITGRIRVFIPFPRILARKWT